MKKQQKNYFIRMLFIGGFVGGFLGFLIPFMNDMTHFLYNQYHIDFLFILEIIILIATLLSLIFTLISYRKLIHYNQNFSSDNDQIEFIHIFNTASKRVVYSSVLGIFLMALSISSSKLAIEGFNNQTLLFIIPAIIIVIITVNLSRKILLFYPLTSNSDFTMNYGEPNLMAKIIDHIDEGERLIMLHSLNKTYLTITYIATFSLIVLAIYQSISGQNQLLAMCCFVFMLIYSTYAYYKKMEEYNK